MELSDEQKSILKLYRVKYSFDPSLAKDDDVWEMIPVGLWDYFHPKHPANDKS